MDTRGKVSGETENDFTYYVRNYALIIFLIASLPPALLIIWNRQSREAKIEFFLHSMLQFPVTSAWIRDQRSNNVNHD